MKTKLLVLVICLFCAIAAFSQTDSVVVKKRGKELVLYLEVAGTSVNTLSVNLEQKIKQFSPHSFLHASIGLGMGFNENISIPISLSYINPIGKKNYNHVDVGTGLVFNSFSYEGSPKSRLLINLHIGYRYQKPEGGWMVRALFTPSLPLWYEKQSGLLDNIDLIYSLLGLSVGYSF